MARLRFYTDLAYGALHRDPVRPLARLALAGDGLARLPLPMRRGFWVVSDPGLLHQVLVAEASRYDKGGPLYQVIADALGDEGLFTVSDPEVWRQLRQSMNPAFQRSAMEGVAALTVRATRDHMNAWDTSRPVAVFSAFKQVNTETIIRYLFGEDVRGAEVRETARLAEPVFEGMAGQVFLPRWAPGGRAYRRAIAAFDERVYGLIARRRASGSEPGDMLGRLLAAASDGGPAFSDEQVRDQVFTTLMAGFDSTATALAWACVDLADDPATLRMLRSEVLDAVGDRSPASRDVGRLPLLTAFLRAVLHAHPSFPLYFRNVRETTSLRGRRIAKGDQLIIAPYVTHHDPAYWPENVGLERFTGKLTTAERSAHLPFGKGNRKCIGEDMALVTGVLMMATLLQRFPGWRRPAKNTGQAIRYAMTAPPKDDARMIFEPADHSSRSGPQPDGP